MNKHRDMNLREFRAALKHHGFKQVLLWVEDTTGQTTTHCGIVVHSKTGKIMRRATLARAIRNREDEVDKADRAADLALHPLNYHRNEVGR